MTEEAKTPEQIAAEIAQAKAEAAKADAEARKAIAEARQVELELEREQEKRREELAADKHHHVYYFGSEVTSSTVLACMKQLAMWHRLEPECPITLVLNSPGGAVVDGMALFDYIQELRRAGHHVTTKSLGYAASMAGILLQAGDKRVMGAESWLLIHEGSFGASGDVGSVEDRVEWVKKILERILTIFAARSTLSKAAIKRRWHRKDWWLSSDEALKYGFCDEIA